MMILKWKFFINDTRINTNQDSDFTLFSCLSFSLLQVHFVQVDVPTCFLLWIYAHQLVQMCHFQDFWCGSLNSHQRHIFPGIINTQVLSMGQTVLFHKGGTIFNKAATPLCFPSITEVTSKVCITILCKSSPCLEKLRDCLQNVMQLSARWCHETVLKLMPFSSLCLTGLAFGSLYMSGLSSTVRVCQSAGFSLIVFANSKA